MPVAFEFDYIHPDYGKVWRDRIIKLQYLSDPNILAALKVYYKAHPAQFISDWGCTFDPRNADIGLPTSVPFLLFKKQEEWVEWVVKKWRNRRPGLTEKSRDIGVSWLAVALACTLCLFNDGIVIGFGSRIEDYVDKIGDPKCIFWKIRMFMQRLPPQFLNGWNIKKDAPHMRVKFPNGSAIVGEGGDNIGRGNRTSIYFVDEAAHVERQELVDAALSNTTNCRMDMSSVCGMDNSFAQKRFGGKIDVFTFHWRDDPRKVDTNKTYELIEDSGIFVSWYEKMKNDLSPVVLAQEVDINYAASTEGVVIPSDWIQAAIGAAKKLGIEVTGGLSAALDVADEGTDLNAIAMRKGIELRHVEEWSGKGSDTLYTTERAIALCDLNDCTELQYDADGIGSSCRSDSRVIDERRMRNKEKRISFLPFRGSGEIVGPEKEMVKGRKNKDFFMNRKAQAWWELQLRFKNTFRAINGEPFKEDQIISIDETLPMLGKLIMELSRPTYKLNTIGKIVIDKSPKGTRSPNLADSVMMAYSPAKRHNGLFTAV